MPHRGKIRQFAKARLIEAYENDEAFLEIVKLMKIKRDIINNYCKKGQ